MIYDQLRVYLHRQTIQKIGAAHKLAKKKTRNHHRTLKPATHELLPLPTAPPAADNKSSEANTDNCRLQFTCHLEISLRSNLRLERTVAELSSITHFPSLEKSEDFVRQM